MLRGLLIRHPHIDKILDGGKTWEIRGARTTIRGTIGLIASGSGTVIGVCDVVDCVGPLTQEQFQKNASKAGIQKGTPKLGHYRQTYAWVLANPKYLKNSVPYVHPAGAVIWVTLDSGVERQVLDQLHNTTSSPSAASLGETGLFAVGEIVSVEYDKLRPNKYDDGSFIAIVVRKDQERMKVIFGYSNGLTELAWLTRDDERVPNRWKDTTNRAYVTVEEASVSQREAIEHYLSKERLAELLNRERQG
jgi:hypothetical protein